MNVKYNKNGTVSILQMPEDLYEAIRTILISMENKFDYEEAHEEWWCDGDVVCVLEKKEKEALDKADWTL